MQAHEFWLAAAPPKNPCHAIARQKFFNAASQTPCPCCNIHGNDSLGKRNRITGLHNEVLHVEPQDANRDIDWDIDLKICISLHSVGGFFNGKLSPLVSLRHSPARGLLLRLGLIA
ncbi:MAG TPA: hypothetical protein DCO83_11255 [Mucilaginibacter sp.]|nr:hypothetical protein [Mucilaginibacter sp.]